MGVEDGGAEQTSNTWRRARSCASGVCVEVRLGLDHVAVRDSKDLLEDPKADFPWIDVPADRWPLFLSEVAGDLNPGTNGAIFFTEQADGEIALTSAASNVELVYDADEWRAFKEGVTEGDFGPFHQTA